VDAKTTTGVTALWLAAGEGRKAVAADLIAKSSDVNNRRTDGITAVMAAAVGGHKVRYRLADPWLVSFLVGGAPSYPRDSYRVSPWSCRMYIACEQQSNPGLPLHPFLPPPLLPNAAPLSDLLW